MYYFEGRKGANADVLSIEPSKEGEKSYIIQFQNEKDVQTALKKSHRLGKHLLKVEKFTPVLPIANYPEKAFISNINGSTSKESLQNFLEGRSKIDILAIEKGESGGSALVTFKHGIDILSLQQQCQQRSLEGQSLLVSSVPMTKCVIVTNFKDGTSANMLELYFDNQKRSGVDGVEETEIDNEQGHCLIHFDNYEAAVRVCERTHIIEGCELNVRPYYECLGKPFDEADVFQCPFPLEMKGIDDLKLKFIRKSNLFQAKLKENLKSYNGKISWDIKISNDLPCLRVECTLNASQKNCRTLAKKWAYETENEVIQMMEGIIVKRYNTFHELWDELLQRVEEMNFENVLIEKDNNCYTISIVGIEDDITDVSTRISLMIHELEKKFDEKKKKIIENYQLSIHEGHMLRSISFDALLMQEIEGLQICIDTVTNKIQFTGHAVNIAQAKCKILEKTKEIVSTKIDIQSKGMIQFIDQPNVRYLIDSELSGKLTTITWETRNENSVVLYAFSDKEAVTAEAIFKETVGEIDIELEESQKSVLKSKSWEEFVHKLEHQNIDAIQIEVNNDSQIITTYATTTCECDLVKIREQIQDFIYTNTIVEYQMALPETERNLLTEHFGQHFKELSHNLSEFNVQMSFYENGIMIRGNKSGISVAEIEIEQMRAELLTFQQRKEIEEHEFIEGLKLPVGIQFCAAARTNSGSHIISVIGDITELYVDGLAIGANPKLEYTAGIAKTIVAKGGQIILDECRNHKSDKGQLSVGNVFFSYSGSLKCKKIVHTVVPVYQDGKHGEEYFLLGCITTLLKQSANHGFTSIAFPAIGTGIFGYPIKEACRLIVKAIKTFFKKNDNTAIKFVYLSDLNDETVECFSETLQIHFPANVIKRPTKEAFEEVNSGQQSQLDIQVIKGELAMQTVDVIVNTTSSKLLLSSGAVSRSLLAAGGPIIQSECDKRYPNGIKSEEIAVTGGGNLACRNIYHGSLGIWSSNETPKELCAFIKTCLLAANKSGFFSIAFPALGTGNLGYPSDQAANLMFEAVETFDKDNPRSSVTDVRFVIYKNDHRTLQAFEQRVKTALPE